MFNDVGTNSYDIGKVLFIIVLFPYFCGNAIESPATIRFFVLHLKHLREIFAHIRVKKNIKLFLHIFSIIITSGQSLEFFYLNALLKREFLIGVFTVSQW